MEVIFVLCVGIILGIVVILSTQRPLIRKRKYGYSKPRSFDYCSAISDEILQCNLDDQHSNKED